jgi:hypothetical protein
LKPPGIFKALSDQGWPGRRQRPGEQFFPFAGSLFKMIVAALILGTVSAGSPKITQALFAGELEILRPHFVQPPFMDIRST